MATKVQLKFANVLKDSAEPLYIIQELQATSNGIHV